MDFVVKLLRVRGRYNVLWVIVDRLTKSTHFILVKDNMDTNRLRHLISFSFLIGPTKGVGYPPIF